MEKMYSYNISSYQLTYANFAMQSQAQNLPITPPLTPPDSCSGSGSSALSAASSLTSQGQQSLDQMKPSKTGRTRIEFSSAQLTVLESEFRDCAYLQRSRRIDIATRLGLTEKHVKVWFQNRRTKCKKEIITNGNKVAKPYPQHHKIVKRLMSFSPNPSNIQVSCSGLTNTNGATYTQSSMPAVQQSVPIVRVVQENKTITPQLIEPAQPLPILKPTVAQLITDLRNQQPASLREFKPQLIVQMPSSNRCPNQNLPQYVIVPKSAQQYQQPSQAKHALITPTPTTSRQFLLQRSSVPDESHQQVQLPKIQSTSGYQNVQSITPLEYQQPIMAPAASLSLQYRQHYKPQPATHKYVVCLSSSQTETTNGAERSPVFKKAEEQKPIAPQEAIQQLLPKQEHQEQQRHPEQQLQRLPEKLNEAIDHHYPNMTLQHQELKPQPKASIESPVDHQNDDQSPTESQSDSTQKLDDAELELYESIFLSISSRETDSPGNSTHSLDLSHIVTNLLTGFEPSQTSSDQSTQNAEAQSSIKNELKVENENLDQPQEQQNEFGNFSPPLSLQSLIEDMGLPEMIPHNEHQEPTLASEETHCLDLESYEQPSHEEKTLERSQDDSNNARVFNPDEILREFEETAKQLSQSHQERQRLYIGDSFMDFTEEHQSVAIESIVTNSPTYNNDFDMDDFVENIEKYVVYPGTISSATTEQQTTSTPECSLSDTFKLSESTIPTINISFEDCFDFSSTLKEPTISFTF